MEESEICKTRNCEKIASSPDGYCHSCSQARNKGREFGGPGMGCLIVIALTVLAVCFTICFVVWVIFA